MPAHHAHTLSHSRHTASHPEAPPLREQPHIRDIIPNHATMPQHKRTHHTGAQ